MDRRPPSVGGPSILLPILAVTALHGASPHPHQATAPASNWSPTSGCPLGSPLSVHIAPIPPMLKDV